MIAAESAQDYVFLLSRPLRDIAGAYIRKVLNT